jgi:dihydroxy-acid dehydratase
MKSRPTHEASAPGCPAVRRQPVIGLIAVGTHESLADPDFDGLLWSVERGARASGAEPRRIVFPAPHSVDGTRWPLRDALADFAETLFRDSDLAGWVLVTRSNENLAALLTAGVRLDRPAIVVPAPLETASEGRAGGGYAENAVACLTEVMGLSLPYSSTVPAGSPEARETAFAAGQRAAELIRQNLTLRRVLTANAFQNAVRLDAALGGSSEAVLFLTALAREAKVKFGWENFDDAGAKTPQVGWFPGGRQPGIAEFHAAGGVPAVLSILKGAWLPHPSSAGRSLVDVAKTARVKDPRLLRVRSPYRKEGGLRILKGNMAPAGAVCRIAPNYPEKQQTFSGPVRVFDASDAAESALRRKQVRRGEVLVVRYAGPKGGPGLRSLEKLVQLVSEQDLTAHVALVTDGCWGAAPGPLLAVEMVSPEAFDSSPLAVLKDGDRVEIDPAGRRLHVFLTDTDQKVRLARWQAPAPRATDGYLARYVRSVGSAPEGASVK